MTDYDEFPAVDGPEALFERPEHDPDTSTEAGRKHRMWRLASERQERMYEAMMRKYRETGDRVYLAIADWYTGGADNLPIDN